MNDYGLIINTVSKFFADVDRCDWPSVCAAMTDRFQADYSSWTGEPAAEVTPEQLTGGWAQVLPHMDQVHHMIGNPIVTIDGEKATVDCHGMATHFIAEMPGGDLQFIVGTYRLTLVRQGEAWKLSGMTFNFKYASGNSELIAETQRRAAA
ncbi:MAG: nuclear transport factor 2 family protein [Pseudomonadota bacterium]